ncbi:hypothetical protein HNP84_009828 [Thermocatellispora tengchongensis]|uniref:Uncharacterized protein n=1 Tax=Thermocatellispora tengchongensis TaxID=1073253 RepID=A0A840PPR9_9ACTN|nr:hypothetical protein [Thermocatellispora tengchongensis]MBB5140063.1 hypothetical protein [Thermocatellispora tengchongensis]
MDSPLSYPGRLPDASGVVVGDRFLALDVWEGAPLGEWGVPEAGVRLADFLASAGVAPVRERVPVVAVGSNAAPAQLRRKFAALGARLVLPMTMATVRGIAAGVSGHVNRHGYVPATPVVGDFRSRLFVGWFDREQLGVLDVTEPNYVRRLVPEGAVTLESGVGVRNCHCYAGRHGHLAERECGTPVLLGSQAAVIAWLLRRSSALARLCGRTPEEFVTRLRGDGHGRASVRDAAYVLMRAEGLVRVQAEFDTWSAGGAG